MTVTRFPFRFFTTRVHPRPTVAPRQFRHRAKRAVWFAIGFALLLQVGMNIVLETIRPEWRDPEYGHRLKQLRRIHAAEPSRPLVVVLGSSRVQLGFKPSQLGLGDGPTEPLVYNLSQAGCGPLHEYLNLRRLLADGVKPDYLLVEVLSPVLAGDGPAEKLVIPQRLSYADVRTIEPYCVNPEELRTAWAKGRILPWYTLRQYLMSHWQGGWMPWQHRHDFMWKQMEPDGWMPYLDRTLTDEERAEKTAEAKVQYAGYFSPFRIAPLPDRAYRDLIAVCREAHIPLAFFIMPEGPDFRAAYPPGARDTIHAYLAGLSKEFGVPLFDACEWLPTDAFADGHHLMRQGAITFSARFGRECLAPWLREAKR